MYIFSQVCMYNTVKHSKHNQIHPTAWDYLAFMLCLTMGPHEFPSHYRTVKAATQNKACLWTQQIIPVAVVFSPSVSPRCFEISNTRIPFSSQSLAAVSHFLARPPGVLSAQLPLPTCSSSPICSDHQFLLVCSRCLCPTSVLRLYGSSFFPADVSSFSLFSWRKHWSRPPQTPKNTFNSSHELNDCMFKLLVHFFFGGGG